MRGAAWLVLWGVVALLLGTRPALADGPVRVVVRVAGVEDEELLARIQGQTVDMEVMLLPERAPLGPSVEAQIAEARGLLSDQDARLAVWVRRPRPDENDDEVLYVVSATDVAVRRAPRPRDAAARSAGTEQMALWVRSALRSWSFGQSQGPAMSSVLEVKGPVGGAAQGVATRPPLGWHLAAGWQIAVDGKSPMGQQGVALHGGVHRGIWLAEVDLLGGVPAHLRDSVTDVALSRHGVGLLGGLVVLLSRRFTLVAGAGAGVLLYYNTTQGLVAGVGVAAGRISPALLLAPEARLVLRPSLSSGLLLELSLAADVVVGAPELGYQEPSGFVARYPLWPVQPRVGLALSYWRN